MNDVARRRLASLAIVLCGAGGAIGWLAFVERNVIPFYMQDWIVQYAAGTAARGGQLALLYDSQRFTDFQAALLPSWMAAPPSLHPWLYPPPFLLLLAPLSRLPFAAGYAAFILPPLAATVTALARRDGGWDWSRAAIVLFFPATLIDLLTGQNALLSAALMIGGVRLLDRWPSAGGAVLGMLVYKPQLYLLVPVALAAARAWRALAASLLAAALLAAASAAAFGLPAWHLWFDGAVRAGDPALATWFADTFLRGYSLYVSALLAGLPDMAARAVQAAGMATGAVAAWLAFRRSYAADTRLAVLLAATIAATPHLLAYDMVLIAATVILLWPRDGIGPGEFVLYAGVWLLPFLRPYNVALGRLAVPVVLLALLYHAARQRWHSTLSPAPNGIISRR